MSQNDERRPAKNAAAPYYADEIVTAFAATERRPAEMPCLLIRIPYEGRPSIDYEAASKQDERRVDYWIQRNPDLAKPIADLLWCSLPPGDDE